MADGRRDFGHRPQRDRVGTPGVSYPTPNSEDLIITEDVPIQNENYGPLLPGTPHHSFPSAVLVWQGPVKGGGNEKFVRRIYSTLRNAQDAYNAAMEYSGESITHPIYIRSYIQPRAGYIKDGGGFVAAYAPATKGLPLTSIVGVVLTAQGNGYSAATASASFTAGGGTGATLDLEVQGGKIVAIWLTNGGTGYTAATSITFLPPLGGSSASGNSVMQPASAVLVKEKVVPAEGELASFFVHVTRIYETLPGPVITSTRLNSRGDVETVTRQRVATGTAATAGGLLVMGSLVSAEDTVVAVKETVTVAAHAALVDYEILKDGFRIKTTKTIVDPSTLPNGSGTGLVSDVVRALNRFQSEQIVRQVTDEAGNPVGHPEIDDVFYDEVTKVKITITRSIVAPGATLPPIGSIFRTTGKVFKSKQTQIDGSEQLMQEVVWGTVPNARSEYDDVGFPFPAIAKLGPLNLTSALLALPWPPPWSGDGILENTYRIDAQRNLKRPGKVYYFYHYGADPAAIPKQYKVLSPGAYSKVWPIPTNCIHPASKATYVESAGSVVIEDLPASTPPTYHPDDVLCVGVTQKEWMGAIVVTQITLISENLPPTLFPVFYVGQVFKATQQNDILVQPNKLGEYLNVRSTSGAEATVIVVYGKLNGQLKKKKITLAGTTIVSTSPEKFDRILHLRAKTNPTGFISLRAGGAIAGGYVEFTSVPAHDDTLTIGKTPGSKVYTFRAPPKGTIVCVAKASMVQGEYVTISVSVVDHRFWFSVDGSDTSIPANPGTLTKVDISGAVSASDVAALLQLAIAALAPLPESLPAFLATVSTSTVTVTSIVLAAFAFVETVANAGFVCTVTQTGSSILDNQIRTLTDIAGAATTVDKVAEYLIAAINYTGTYLSGKYVSSSISPDLTASLPSADDPRVFLEDKTGAPETQVWTLSKTGTSMTLTAFTSGAGPLIAQLDPGATAPYNKHAYRDIIFNNPDLIDGDVSGPGLLERLPATVTATTDAILAPAGSGLKLQMVAAGTPAIPLKYQLAPDSGGVPGAWSDGSLALPNIGSGAYYEIGIPETNVVWIRMVVNNSAGEEARAVHLALLWQVA